MSGDPASAVRQWSCPTRVFAGPGSLRQVVDARRRDGRRIGLVVDAGVTATPAVAWLRDHRADSPMITVDPVGSGVAGVGDLAGWLRGQPADGLDTVVAVGGGSLLDLVKLGCLAMADPDLPARLGAGRSGVVALPAPPAGTVPHRVLVPTTVGTGSEISPVACVGVRGRHRLALCEGMRAEVAVLDPAATHGLPRPMVVEGVLEALMRLLGPFVGSPEPRPVADAAALSLVTELVRLGDRLAAGRPGQPTGEQRLLAAELSAYTHAGWSLIGRDPFGGKAWYLANEVASVLAVSKMVATVPMTAGVWSRVAAGDTRFGGAGRLAVAWDATRRASGHRLPADAARGIRRLADGWGVPRCPVPAAAQLADIARRVTHAFGGGLPALARISHADVTSLLRESLNETANETAPDEEPWNEEPPRGESRCQPAGAAL
ncbi:daptide-type RiPP biosynthesis dehydogenase [Parafrankia discariae]|uniref:daptide-type RiPP biosynthesis dehydogenase n=1 Tax=Parafrankia discariae TaxID=365528 RepID=UPI0003A3D490|nr:daptide-type RiPP biosynthesis dehydogenase [Parafrankia discariae]